MLRRFPVQMALAALLVYALTLSWGVTANSLPLAANVAGWEWRPMTNQPLVWLVTLPLRVLPEGWIPIALNFFAATCAAAVIGILARSVELLGWGHLLKVGATWRDKLPVVLACALCAFEFNF